MAMMEISIVPVGTGKAGVSSYVAKALKTIEKSELKYMLTPMGTIIIGDITELFSLAEKIHSTIMEDVNRVVAYIKIDDRKDKPLTFNGKLKSVMEKL